MARFAHAHIGRLLLTALVFGLVAGSAATWLGATGWAPAIDEAVAALPTDARVHRGTLQWPERAGRLLGANAYLSLEVVLQNAPRDSSAADIAVEAHLTYVVVRSVLGATTIPIPPVLSFTLDRSTLVPAWGAWRAPLLFGLIPGTALLLMICWAVLAVPYSLLAMMIGVLFQRDLTFRKAWKLCMAAQLPGSVLMAFAIALYASGQVSILFIVVMFVAHFVPTLLFLLISPVLVPKRPREVDDEDNPFEDEKKKRPRGKNPFAGAKG